jgi:hypothetical protein
MAGQFIACSLGNMDQAEEREPRAETGAWHLVSVKEGL